MGDMVCRVELEKQRINLHTRDYPAPVILGRRASKINSHQVPEHRSTTKKRVTKQTAAAMEKPHCTPTSSPQVPKARCIDGACLSSPFIEPSQDQLDEISLYSPHQQCSTPRTPSGRKQGTTETYRLPAPPQPSSITDTKPQYLSHTDAHSPP